MTLHVCQVIVIIFGIAVGLLSIWGIIVPNKLIAMVSGVMSKPSGMYAAIVARLILGVALIISAPDSMYPAVFTVLGWITIVAAFVLPIMGRARIAALLGWFERTPKAAIRVWLLFGLMFGAFLVYAV